MSRNLSSIALTETTQFLMIYQVSALHSFIQSQFTEIYGYSLLQYSLIKEHNHDTSPIISHFASPHF